MVKLHRLRDIQIGVSEHTLPLEEVRRTNITAFTIYEPIRLWVKERKILGPFVKISIELRREDEPKHYPPSAVVVDGLGLIDMYPPVAALKRAHEDRDWIFSQFMSGLALIHEQIHWRSEELEAGVAEIRAAGVPFTHDFSKFTKKDRSTKTTFTTFMRIEVGLSKIGVRISTAGQPDRELIVFEKGPLLFLEDDYPIHKATLRDGAFLLLDKTGKELARVPPT